MFGILLSSTISAVVVCVIETILYENPLFMTLMYVKLEKFLYLQRQYEHIYAHTHSYSLSINSQKLHLGALRSK